MAKSKDGDGKEARLKEDPLVAALVPDPSAESPDTTVLHGYVGKSTRPNYWRLYLDATLTSYVEMSGDDVRHQQQLGDGGTLVWVPRSLELKITKVSSTTIQAEFLSGAIAAGRMQAKARVSAASLAALPRTVGCPSILNNCTTLIIRCPSDGCPTWENCPTETGWCRPSEFAPLCTIFGF